MTEMRVCTCRGTGFALVATLAATVVLTATSTYAGTCDVTVGAPPAGDGAANAVDLGSPALPILLCGNTCDNQALGELDLDCADPMIDPPGDSPDEWFMVTLPAGNYDFSMCSLDGFDSKLYVLDTGFTTLFGCDDDGCGIGAGPSEIGCVLLDAGTYFVVVDGFNTAEISSCGPYELSIAVCEECSNTIAAGGTPEAENCATGLPSNDGCNDTMNPDSAYQNITLGAAVRGTAIFDGTTRDTDWYRFVATANAEYTWSVDSEFPALIGLAATNTPGNPACADGTGFISPAGFINQENNCMPATVTTGCLPGNFNDTGSATYKWFVAPQFVFITACTPASERIEYRAVLNIVPGSTGCVVIEPPTDCEPADFEYTQNTDPTPAAGNVACVDGQPEGQYSSDNTFARVYTNTDGDVEITCMEFGVETNSGSAAQVITGRVQLLSMDTDPPTTANITGLAGSESFAVPSGFGPERLALTFDSPLPISDNQVIIVEGHWDETTPGVDPVGALFPGGNPAGATRPVYILSVGCGLADYVALEDIGPFPDDTIVDYSANTGGGCPADFTGPAGPGNPDGNVDSLDFLLMLAEWGSPCNPGANLVCDSDITGSTPLVPDGNTDSLDFLLLLAQWGSPGNCP